MFHLVQKVPSSKSKGLAIGWLIGQDDDAALRKALPGWSIVTSAQAPLTVPFSDLQLARKMVDQDSEVPVLLFGFSAGCQSVRNVLISNHQINLIGVGVFDGTHAPVEAKPEDYQIALWAELIERAQRGEFLFAGTCTEMTYTKDIPVGQPGRAMPTRWVLEKAYGSKLVPGSPVHEKGLYLECFPSKMIDKQAHIAQQNVAMPKVLGIVFGDAKIQEEIPITRRKSVPPPHGYRISVRELVEDSRKTETYRGRDYSPRPGDLCVLSRAGGDPTKGGTGHICRVKTTPDGFGSLVTVGGNENNTWRETPRTLHDRDIVCWIAYPEELGLPCLDWCLAETELGIKEIPGAKHHPSIVAYHRPCRRGGGPTAGMLGDETGALVGLTSDETEWCASAQSASLLAING